VREARISPDGSRVVYLADQDADELLELYSVPIDGGMSMRLNADLPPERTRLSSCTELPDRPPSARP